jgi:hypothetical protein
MKVSAATIERLTPIIQAIDDELTKEQEDREDFKVYTTSANSMKNALVHYKAVYKAAEWNGKFWMVKGKDKKADEEYLEFRFSNLNRTRFEISKVGVKDDDVASVDIPIIRKNTPVPADGPVLEMNDNQISQMILMENPTSATFDRKFLSKETNNFLDNSRTAEPSALINVALRRGYQVVPVLGTRMRIFR